MSVLSSVAPSIPKSPRFPRNIAERIVNRYRMQAAAARLRRLPPDERGERYVDYGWLKLLFSDDGDKQELYYHAHSSEYYANDFPIYSKLLKPGDVAVDVGANLGWTAVLMASFVGSAGHVFAFEPAKSIFAKLLKTIAANGLEAVITPLNLACGGEAGCCMLNRVSTSSGNSSIVNAAPGAQTESIDVVRLDDVAELKEQRITLIKIDTEGYEPMVLAGSAALIAREKPLIYLEMGGDYLQSTLESRRILEAFGYRLNSPKDVDWSRVGNGSNFLAVPV